MSKATWNSYAEVPRSLQFEKELRKLCHNIGVSCEVNTVPGKWSLFGTVDTIFFKISGEASKVQSIVDSVKQAFDKYNNS